MLSLNEYVENRNKVIKDYNKGKHNNSTYYKGYMFDGSTQKLIINKWYKQREYSYDDIQSYSCTKDYDGIKGIGCLGWLIIIALCFVGIGFFILLWALLKRKKQMLGHLAIYVTMKDGTTETIKLIDKPTDVRKAQKQLNMYNKMSSLLGSIVK